MKEMLKLMKCNVKAAFSGLRQFLATESSLKKMNTFDFTLKSSFRSQDS